MLSPKSLSLRELADWTEMSLSGTSDVLNRLKHAQVVQKKAVGNKLLYSLHLESEEQEFFKHALDQAVKDNLKSRANMFSARKPYAIGWINETISTIKHGRNSINKTA